MVGWVGGWVSGLVGLVCERTLSCALNNYNQFKLPGVAFYCFKFEIPILLH